MIFKKVANLKGLGEAALKVVLLQEIVMEDSYITSDHIQYDIVKQKGKKVVDYSERTIHEEVPSKDVQHTEVGSSKFCRYLNNDLLMIDDECQNNLHGECIEDIGDILVDNIGEDNMYMDCGSSKANEVILGSGK
ncbi:hypothetical protein L1887_39183 [Cichorium endivia]|nr:hypothetical protein L1887_39183 [Cichorium endivia]